VANSGCIARTTQFSLLPWSSVPSLTQLPLLMTWQYSSPETTLHIGAGGGLGGAGGEGGGFGGVGGGSGSGGSGGDSGGGKAGEQEPQVTGQAPRT